MMKWLLILAALLPLIGCQQAKKMQAGGLYSIDDGEGRYQVAKILVLDNETVHIRIYKNTWEERPISIDRSTLSLGTIHDEDGFGIGHLPISAGEFENWNPALLQIEKVSEEELEGYRMWQDANGGTF
ncbi:MAG: hypothetical protein AAGI48_08830 [Verrucomicrobiota bacterium]